MSISVEKQHKLYLHLNSIETAQRELFVYIQRQKVRTFRWWRQEELRVETRWSRLC